MIQAGKPKLDQAHRFCHTEESLCLRMGAVKAMANTTNAKFDTSWASSGAAIVLLTN